MPLEGGRSICKSKRHDFVLKVAYTSLKRSKVFVFFSCYLNPIKGMVNINLH